MAKRKKEKFVSATMLHKLIMRLDRRRECYAELEKVVWYLGSCIDLTDEEQLFLEKLQERMEDEMRDDEKNLIAISNRL